MTRVRNPLGHVATTQYDYHTGQPVDAANVARGSGAAGPEPTAAGSPEPPLAPGRYLPMTRRYRRGRPRGSGTGPRTNVAGEPDRTADAAAGGPA